MANNDPIALFLEARARAMANEPWDAAAGALATADASGRPSVRYLLFKEVDAEGFWFYTHEGSQKGRELAANPWASVAFHWPSVKVQFRIDGPVHTASDERSDAYFACRPRVSQLGAWASAQSRALASREELMSALRDFEVRFDGQPVPRPAHWRGYRVFPHRIEHWLEGEYRLHHRALYEREGSGWSVTLLSP